MAVVIVLEPDQAVDVMILAEDLDLPPSTVVQHLLSGPLARHLGESIPQRAGV